MRTLICVVIAEFLLTRGALAEHMYGGGGWGWDHMRSWGGGFAAMWVAILVLIGILIYLALRRPGAAGPPDRDVETPLSILQKRYARGEISKEEFEERRRHLGV